jgi:starch synthase
MKIAMVASEAVPFVKTGGLADVTGALSLELARLGHEVTLFLPRYQQLAELVPAPGRIWPLRVPSSSGSVDVTIEELTMPGLPPTAKGKVTVLAVRYDPFFRRAGLYQEHGRDYPDNLQRFSLFCRATIEWLLTTARRDVRIPDVLHLHDWQTALCAVYVKTLYRLRPELTRLRTLLTLHNVGYQGTFPGDQFPQTGLPAELFTPGGLEFYGLCNLLKGGLIYADSLATVSSTYSQEIQTPEFGFGLEGVIKERKDRLRGIVNGIDMRLWNPATDPLIPAHYSATELEGKGVCKRTLRQQLGLPTEGSRPLLAIVSRLTTQKGFDLVLATLSDLLAHDLQLVILGTGDKEYEQAFQKFEANYPQKIRARFLFDEALAHRIFAGADIFLMPSRYEPCGLSQLYSLRYGTVPVVRRTGGLADTIAPYSRQGASRSFSTGFVFDVSTPDAFFQSVCLALSVFKERSVWNQLVRTGMQTDVSWQHSAREYESLYVALQENPKSSAK